MITQSNIKISIYAVNNALGINWFHLTICVCVISVGVIAAALLLKTKPDFSGFIYIHCIKYVGVFTSKIFFNSHLTLAWHFFFSKFSVL